MGASARLQVERISKRFGAQRAVDSLSFAVAPGEVVGFVGPNGAGKSTTLRIISGLISPDSGRVLLDGVDLRSDPIRFRARIGVLIESPAIYPMLTAFDHLAYIARLRGACEKAAIDRALRDVGLAPDSKKVVGKFSLGMKQRLGIAMALFLSPSLLVLDEPMNGLDPSGIAELRTFLRDLPGRHRRERVDVESPARRNRADVPSGCLHPPREVARRGGPHRRPAGRRRADLAADGRRREDGGGAAGVAAHRRGLPGVGRSQLSDCHQPCAELAPLLVARRINLFEMTSQRPRLEETSMARYGDDETRLR